jgi:tripartite-type tricarboxylate transporter receptor subunit TctC
MAGRRILAAALAIACYATAAAAQTYPTKPIKLIVPYTPGSPVDVLARVVTQQVSARLGQSIVIDNRPGAGTTIGTKLAASADPDGYTLLIGATSFILSFSLYQNLDYDPVKSFAPVTMLAHGPQVLVVAPSVPAVTVQEFIAYAKANPGKIKMASTGNGSSPHVSGELFKIMTGVEMPVVHYAGGGPALKAMIEGEAQMMFEPMSASIEPVRSGKLRPLAVTTATRSAALPDIPILADAVPGYEASAVTGIGVPKDTPAEIVDALNKAVNAAFADAKMTARLADTGGSVLPGSPGEFGKLLADETEKWAKVVKASGAKAN